MKEGIHPKYGPCRIECACGAVYETRSTRSDYKIAVCSSCHPAYTGEGGQRIFLAAGQIEKFRRRYGQK